MNKEIKHRLAKFKIFFILYVILASSIVLVGLSTKECIHADSPKKNKTSNEWRQRSDGVKVRRVTLYDGEGIFNIAKEYLGTPYKYGGNTPAGFDCSGFVQFVFKKGGFQLPRSADIQFVKLKKVPAPEVGDLVYYRIDGKKISHVGIYAGDHKFIHAPSSGKSVEITDMNIPYWKSRYAGARTVYNVE